MPEEYNRLCKTCNHRSVCKWKREMDGVLRFMDERSNIVSSIVVDPKSPVCIQASCCEYMNEEDCYETSGIYIQRSM